MTEVLGPVFEMLRSQDQEVVNEAQRQLFELKQTQPLELLSTCADFILGSEVQLFAARQSLILIRNILKPTQNFPFQKAWNSLGTELQSKLKDTLLRGLLFDDKIIRSYSALLSEQIFHFEKKEDRLQFWPKLQSIKENPEECGETGKLGVMEAMDYVFKDSQFYKEESIEQCSEAAEEMSILVAETLNNESSIEWKETALNLLLTISQSNSVVSKALNDDTLAGNLFTGILGCFISFPGEYKFHSLCYTALYQMIKLHFMQISSIFEQIAETVMNDLDSTDAEYFDMCCNFWKDISSLELNYDPSKHEEEEKPELISPLIIVLIPKLLSQFSTDIEDDQLRNEKNTKRKPISASNLIQVLYIFDQERIEAVLNEFYLTYIDGDQWNAVSAALYAVITKMKCLHAMKSTPDMAFFTENYPKIISKFQFPECPLVLRESIYNVLKTAFQFKYRLPLDVIQELINNLFAFSEISLYDSFYIFKIINQIVINIQLTDANIVELLNTCFRYFKNPDSFDGRILKEIEKVITSILVKKSYLISNDILQQLIQRTVDHMNSYSISLEMTDEKRFILQGTLCSIFLTISKTSPPDPENIRFIPEIIPSLVEVIQNGFINPDIFIVLAEFLYYLEPSARVEYYQPLLEKIKQIFEEKDMSLIGMAGILISKTFPIFIYPEIMSVPGYQELIEFCISMSNLLIDSLLTILIESTLDLPMFISLLEALGYAFSSVITRGATEEALQYDEQVDTAISICSRLLMSEIPNEYELQLITASLLIYRTLFVICDNPERLSEHKRDTLKIIRRMKNYNSSTPLNNITLIHFINFVNDAMKSPYHNALTFLTADVMFTLIKEIKAAYSINITKEQVSMFVGLPLSVTRGRILNLEKMLISLKSPHNQ